MIKILRRYKWSFLCSIFIFFASFIFTYIFMPMGCDDVWLYGFSYNISKGLIIYRDFSVVTTPLYYFFGCLFIKIFGSYIISVGIFNSLLVAGIFFMMFQVIKYKAFIVIPLIFVFFPNGYNLFCLFWLMLVLLLIFKKKDSDILIGFIIGLVFITKQNIGFCLFIPYIYYARNSIKAIIVFIIPFILICIYMLMYGGLYSFIDCCFFGLFDFGTNNHFFDIYGGLELLILLFLVLKVLKSKFKNKELFYILMFQVMCYPLFDGYHCFVCYFPVLYYLLKRENSIHFLIILVWFIYFFHFSLVCNLNISVHLNRDVLFLKNAGDISELMKDFNKYLYGVDNYYFTGYYGYLYKLYYDIPIGHYDLWNDGNLGYKGVDEKIREVNDICERGKCLFIVDGDLESNQKSQVAKFYNYILENYKLIDEFDTFLIYSND